MTEKDAHRTNSVFMGSVPYVGKSEVVGKPYQAAFQPLYQSEFLLKAFAKSFVVTHSRRVIGPFSWRTWLVSSPFVSFGFTKPTQKKSVEHETFVHAAAAGEQDGRLLMTSGLFGEEISELLFSAKPRPFRTTRRRGFPQHRGRAGSARSALTPGLQSKNSMFVPPPHAALTERQQQQSRGYVLGLILLVLFLSSQDFSPPSRRRVEAAQGGTREGLVGHREDVKDKVRIVGVMIIRLRNALPSRRNNDVYTHLNACPERSGNLTEPLFPYVSTIVAPSQTNPRVQIIVDLSTSNEQLELENRRLKVGVIGLLGELRGLGKVDLARQYNLTGLGVFAGHDANLDDDANDETNKSTKEKSPLKHEDAGMLRREEVGRGTPGGGDSGDGKEGEEAMAASARRLLRNRVL
jgi:hypothetical protein